MSEHTSVPQLPTIVLRHIVSFCPLLVAKAVRRTCKYFHNAILPHDIREITFRTLLQRSTHECLIWMATRGQLSYVKRTLTHDPSLQNNANYSFAIHEAAYQNRVETIAYFLGLAKEPFKSTGHAPRIMSSIYIAAENGYPELLSLLLHNFEPNLDYLDRLYLRYHSYYAARKGLADGVNQLLVRCSDSILPGSAVDHQSFEWIINDALNGCIDGDQPFIAANVLKFAPTSYGMSLVRRFLTEVVQKNRAEFVEACLQDGLEMTGFESVRNDQMQIVLMLEFEQDTRGWQFQVITEDGENECVDLLRQIARRAGLSV